MSEAEVVHDGTPWFQKLNQRDATSVVDAVETGFERNDRPLGVTIGGGNTSAWSVATAGGEG